jgi:succinate dehydrogenase / fumarate reductase flavoprotein subunit
MSTVAGLFASGECAAGINGANRLGGNSLSDLLVLGRRAGEFAARFAREHPLGRLDEAGIEAAARETLRPFERGAGAENPFGVQEELQGMMQDLVGIVRTEGELRQALDGLERLRERAARAGVIGSREYNPAWHTALDLDNLLVVAEAITRSGLERRESRGGHFREDHPRQDPALGRVNVVVRRGGSGEMEVRRVPIPDVPAELRQVLEEQA